ncbi:MAG: serine hydrolase, partial [Chitinophagales bacterium]|nr:serine hydrolase [Chitinophagales bacterium]
MYFPPVADTTWETTSITELGWNEEAVEPLLNYLADKNSKSFMILVGGKIVLEAYFDGHNAEAEWQWNSAGKTLVSATSGIAQLQGVLNINNKVSDYLGSGWTS